ncbi:hypothetical protein [Kribbella deserti]|uniref:Uncharacterized protein n=1 Tax=Kribbella deserti TaxID=1926257 RepID=A0ABV6QCR5_9ACTN
MITSTSTDEVGDEIDRIKSLVNRAEALLDQLTEASPHSQWAMATFSRHRVSELLGTEPFEPVDGPLEGDSAQLYEEAAVAVENLEVHQDQMAWALALSDALRTVVHDIRIIQDATRHV